MDTIKLMLNNNAVDGLEISNKSKSICEDCALNKCTRVNHPTRTTSKTKLPGTVLHVDTSGPSSAFSRGKSKYLILCKDEFSKYRHVSFAKTKDKVPDKVKTFITKAILETGNQVLKLVTENGKEHVNKKLASFLKSRGILHECSASFVPNQNGLIERDIRSIKGKSCLENQQRRNQRPATKDQTREDWS